MSKIYIEATKSAPETVQVGNHSVSQKKGIFAVGNRELADWMIAQRYGKEIEKPSGPAPKRAKKLAPKRKPVATPVAETVESAPKGETVVAAKKEAV